MHSSESQRSPKGKDTAGAVRRALILVVERDPHAQKLERFFLEEAGFEVEFSDTGDRGLALARELRPVIVIAEILMPGLDGVAVCRALKGAADTRHIAVVLFSNLDRAEQAREAGADAFLRKPVDDRSLKRTVSEVFARGAGR
jgi:CheY-like chemotaxis protein